MWWSNLPNPCGKYSRILTLIDQMSQSSSSEQLIIMCGTWIGCPHEQNYRHDCKRYRRVWEVIMWRGTKFKRHDFATWSKRVDAGQDVTMEYDNSSLIERILAAMPLSSNNILLRVHCETKPPGNSNSRRKIWMKISPSCDWLKSIVSKVMTPYHFSVY